MSAVIPMSDARSNYDDSQVETAYREGREDGRREAQAEVRRLRALLTAPPDDEEIEAAYRQFDLLGTTKQAVIAAFACRTRKIGGDTDE